jgi:hypothetical protein
MKGLTLILLLVWGAQAMLNPLGAMKGGGGSAQQAPSKDQTNRFPEQVEDTTRKLVDTRVRTELLNTIDRILVEANAHLENIKSKFVTKIAEIRSLAETRVRKLVEGIRAETQKLSI